MTINRSLYIVTEQVKDQAEHNVSVGYVGYSPKEAFDSVKAFVGSMVVGPTYGYFIHRVNHNHMGAKDVQIVTLSDLFETPEPPPELDAAKDTEETRI